MSIPLLPVHDLGAHGPPAAVDGVKAVVEEAGVRGGGLVYDVTPRAIECTDSLLVYADVCLEFLRKIRQLLETELQTFDGKDDKYF